MKVRCLYDKLVPIEELKAHPKNANKHPDSQVQRLAQIIEYQGWRYPLKVSKRTGYITAGHGRLLAAKRNGWSQVPVNFQDYDSEEQEYADVQADNAIASWAELDLSQINQDIGDLGPDFDIDLLGIKDFVLEPADKLTEFDPAKHWDSMPEFFQDDKTGIRRIIVTFKTQADVQAFAKVIGQPLTEKTRSIWYPKAEIERLMDKRYESAEP